MATISELIKRVNSLTKGDIYKKKINGKIYYYHQYFDNGKRYTHIVKQDDVPLLIEEIKQRKELEKKIKYLKSLTKIVVVSDNAKNLTGSIMLKDKVVATFEQGELLYNDEQYAPLIINRTKSVQEFLKLRAIDFSRTNARILRKALNIKPLDEDYLITLYSYALSISDRYWFKPKQSKLTYEQVKFNSDYFFETALNGKINNIEKNPKMTPEITTVGSFEKGWKIINNEWWLYKIGSQKEIFSELFCYHFAKLIHLPTAVYEYDNGLIRSKNFASKDNYEPIYSIVGNNEDYDYIYSSLFPLGKDICKQYLKLIFFDSVIYNIDRHNENFGLMRDSSNGQIISLAPNFDNNLALVSTRDELEANAKKDGFVSMFIKFIDNNKSAKELFNEIDLPDISIDDLYQCLDKIEIRPGGIDLDRLMITILQRYEGIKKLINKQDN